MSCRASDPDSGTDWEGLDRVQSIGSSDALGLSLGGSWALIARPLRTIQHSDPQSACLERGRSRYGVEEQAPAT
jgi:hypothetical protein